MNKGTNSHIKGQTKSIVDTITQRFDGWNTDTERLVLYADFMGFKERVIKTPHYELKRQMKDFRRTWERQMTPLIMSDNLRFAQFSDSILIVANGTSWKMFNLITKAAARLMHVALSKGFALKGVLAEGIFTYGEKSELYFGRPLVDAYLLHEQIKYYGVVVHHTAEKVVKKFADVNDNPYTNSQIMLEKGLTGHYHLCWNMIDAKLEAIDCTEDCMKLLDKIAETVSGKPRIYIDNTKKVLEADQKEVNEQKNKIGTDSSESIIGKAS